MFFNGSHTIIYLEDLQFLKEHFLLPQEIVNHIFKFSINPSDILHYTNYKRTKEYLDAGVHPDTCDYNGNTRLINTSDYDIMKLLLEYGANPNIITRVHKRSALHLNIRSERLMKLLLDYGADPNIKDKNGHTPLHLFDELSIEQMELLLEKGGNPNSISNNSYSPLDLITFHKRFGCLDKEKIKVIIKAGGKLYDDFYKQECIKVLNELDLYMNFES